MVDNLYLDKHKRRMIMEIKIPALQVVTDNIQFKAIFLKIKVVLDQWNQNLETRKHLRELDDDQLRDIGVDRITALRESQKPFWQD